MAKSEQLKDQSVKMRWATVQKLKNLHIEMWGVEFDTYDSKVNHLIWFFDNYKKEK